MSNTKRIARKLAGLLGAQAVVQILGIASGFMMLRWLSIEGFAQYSIAFAFGSTLTLLVDVGFAATVVALAGERAREPQVLGEYIKIGRRFRNALTAIAVPVSAVGFLALTQRHHWGVATQAGLFASVLATLLARNAFDYHAIPLTVSGRFRDYFRPQINSGICRIAAVVVLYVAKGLNSVTASLLNAAVLAMNGRAFKKAAVGLVDEPATTDPIVEQEMRHYIRPLVPALVFFAFQAQVAVLVASTFAGSRSIAEVGALSRLGGLFLIPTALNAVVVMPYVARQPATAVRGVVALVLGLAGVAAAIVTLGAFLYPVPLLALLGGNYANLATEAGWYILASSLSYLSAVLYAVNSARRFLYHWASIGGPIAIIAAQIGGLALFEVDTTLGVTYLLVLTNAVILVVSMGATAFGFVRGPRVATAGVVPLSDVPL